MDPFKIYQVITVQVKTGKSSEAQKWWSEKGKAAYESGPGVKSAKAYAVQFGLGGSFLEFWMEMENYAAFDRIDEDLDANPQKYAAFGEFSEIFESSTTRIMGDWPESHWSAPKE
jgi:hypothetical protein